MADQDQQMVRAEVLAQLFGLSIESIYRITKSGVIKTVSVPGETARMYPMYDSIKSYIAHLESRTEGKGKVDDAIKKVTLAEKKLKLRKLKTETLLAEANAHSTDDVRRVWNDVIGSFKTQLFAFPQTVIIRIPEDIRDMVKGVLEEEIKNLCGLLREYDAEAFYARNSGSETEVEEFGDDHEEDSQKKAR